jgi:acylphosphatase
MAEKKAVRAKIEGRVQGVNFRNATAHAAKRHGVHGWVMNRPDGSVEAFFEGDADKVDSVLDWCKKGPPHASVIDITVSEEEFTDQYTDFSVRYR